MSKKQTVTTDEQLFERHRKARESKKRKLRITIASILVVVLLVVVVGVNALKQKVNEQMGSGSKSEVLSAEASIGSISTTVSGSGTLSAEDVEELEVPSALEIVEYYVEIGDFVEERDLIATVTNASILTALSDAQKALDDLDDELEKASGDEVSATIKAGASGRIKVIHVASGDDVASAMYEHGALILLSLDGYMFVEIPESKLAAGDRVTVVLSDDSTVEGKVEKNVNGTATILVTDKGTAYGDEVIVKDSEDNELGKGKLAIHSQMMVTGYAGTVDTVKVKENDKVKVGDTLLTLEDTETSANYDALLRERKELEEDLNTLIKIYKEGGVCATIAGVVDSLESTSDEQSAIVATISPNTKMAIQINIDETDILSLSVGQEATVSIDSIGSDSYTGKLTEVNTTATSSSGVTYYSATITIDKTEKMLSGMSASVVITIEGADNALLIPVDALHQTSSTAYVYTSYNEETGEFSGMKEVVTGLSNSSYVEIKEGLNQGDVVYYTEEEENSGFGNMGGFGGSGSGFPGGGSNGGFPGGSGDSGFPGGSSGGFPGGGSSGGRPNFGN